MTLVVIWSIIHWIMVALSVTLIGERSLISGNLLNLRNALQLIFHWKFMSAMVFALAARFSFILLNNSLLKIPWLARNSTTITAFISTASILFIIFANYLYLNERINLQQGIGGLLVMAGIFIIMVK